MEQKNSQVTQSFFVVVVQPSCNERTFKSFGMEFDLEKLWFPFLIFDIYFRLIQVGSGSGGSRAGVTNGPETAASLLAAGLDARAAELVSFWLHCYTKDRSLSLSLSRCSFFISFYFLSFYKLARMQRFLFKSLPLQFEKSNIPQVSRIKEKKRDRVNNFSSST